MIGVKSQIIPTSSWYDIINESQYSMWKPLEMIKTYSKMVRNKINVQKWVNFYTPIYKFIKEALPFTVAPIDLHEISENKPNKEDKRLLQWKFWNSKGRD